MSASGNIRRSTPKDDWATPPAFMKVLAEEFTFTLDVCADASNAKAAKWFEGPCKAGRCTYCIDRPDLTKCCVCHGSKVARCTCGLCSDWGNEVCWLNPPYGDIRPWVLKATDQQYRWDATVVALLPASHGNDWYGLASQTCSEERRVRERIQFIHPPGCECKACMESRTGSNTTDSFLFIWRPGAARWLTNSPRTGLWSWRS